MNLQTIQNPSKFNICIICDFYYPKLGGVEMHIFQLAICLIERGHKVIIVSRTYDNRQGVRYMTSGVKVYYLPLKASIDNLVIFPSFLGTMPLLRKILIRENINIVHCHQSTSVLGLESILSSKIMGYRTIFTDHSLFGFDDMAGIHLNKLQKLIFSDLDHAICVSHTGRENLCLRASLDPNIISVIPNAVDSSRFTPDPSQRYPLGKINIVIMARLTYRKGIDLLVDIVPQICQKYPNAHFIIGGDGPKFAVLEYMIDKNNLHDRVELLGSVPHKDVRNVLVRGHIFLNTSLTEAFCIAIVEAAACGLLVVSTNVGGVTEVLPHDMIYLAPCNPVSLTEELEKAIANCRNIPTHEMHDRVKSYYNWRDVAKRTEIVYDKVLKLKPLSIQEKIKRYYSCGPYAGMLMTFLATMLTILFLILQTITPAEKIEKAVDFPYEEYKENWEKYGDHQFDVLSKKQK